jgi:Lrp/AsnC family leucine-responsive transcriptional regulator
MSSREYATVKRYRYRITDAPACDADLWTREREHLMVPPLIVENSLLLLCFAVLDRLCGYHPRMDQLQCSIRMHDKPSFLALVLLVNLSNAPYSTHISGFVCNMSDMDALDTTIIACLTRDGRMPYSRIADEAGVATTTVHQRVRRLTERGIITGTRVKVDWEALGLPVTAVISVTAPDDRPLKDVAEGFRSIPFVYSCYAVTGEFDLLVMVRARSSNHLGELLEEIRQYAPGRTRAIVVLATYYEGQLPTLEVQSGSLSSR